jgi:hypothetical protein
LTYRKAGKMVPKTVVWGVIGLLGLAACSSGKVDTGVKAQSTSPPPPARSTTTLRTDFALGDKVTTAEGNTVQARTFELPIKTTGAYPPRPAAGSQFGAADIEVCAVGDARAAGRLANPPGYSVKFSDNTEAEGSLGQERKPGLPARNLVPGECVRGWVSFEIPKTERPTFVAFDFMGTAIRWALPGA